MTVCNNPLPASHCTRQDKRRALRLLSRYRGATDRLVAQRDVLQIGSRPDRFFWRAILESFAFHYLHCPDFQADCLNRNLHPSDLPETYSLASLPFIEIPASNQTNATGNQANTTGDQRTHTGADSIASWRSCPDSAIKVRYPEVIPPHATPELKLDARSLRRLKRSWLNLGNSLRLSTREKTNYLSLTAAKTDAISFGQSWLSLLTRIHSYCVSADWPNPHLESLIQEGSGLRIIGSLSQLLTWIEDNISALPSLPARSMVWVWDNWDKHPAFLTEQQRVAASFKVTADKVRFACLVPYLGTMLATCACGHLHLPHTLRVLVRDSHTLEPVPAGIRGRLQVISPCLSSQARPSVLLRETGVLHTGCTCGIKTPYIELTSHGDMVHPEPQ